MTESPQGQEMDPQQRDDNDSPEIVEDDTVDEATASESPDSEDEDSPEDRSFLSYLQKFVLMGILAIAYYYVAQTIESLYQGRRLKIPERHPRDDGLDKSIWETFQGIYELGKKWLIQQKRNIR